MRGNGAHLPVEERTEGRVAEHEKKHKQELLYERRPHVPMDGDRCVVRKRPRHEEVKDCGDEFEVGAHFAAACKRTHRQLL